MVHDADVGLTPGGVGVKRKRISAQRTKLRALKTPPLSMVTMTRNAFICVPLLGVKSRTQPQVAHTERRGMREAVANLFEGKSPRRHQVVGNCGDRRRRFG